MNSTLNFRRGLFYEKILNYDILSTLWNPSRFLDKNRPILGEMRTFHRVAGKLEHMYVT
jgi:hypothetical protein